MNAVELLNKIDEMPDEKIDKMMEATFVLEVTASELMELHAGLVRYLKTPEGHMTNAFGDGATKELMLRIRNLIKNHLGTYGLNINEEE